ncbi:O-antigen polymerase [Anoxynatronum buryatiense]|uniref:Oligosaccharide repeat unit polymerase n=1 Tax=Anoxynatronum buryatiense TaxID=489973 RepID=A0AA46AJ27_9CLOT|nr:O-antigen polymerase [Anoxynatronum buryatiense]SMP56761.1 oligosaccharide repeat unit polymerase [Anoxynatronum buryatiense]
MNFWGYFLFSFFAIYLYMVFYWITKDVLNPPGIMISIWLFFAGVSHLNLGSFQRDWIPETYWAIILSAFSMTIAGLLLLKGRRARLVSLSSRRREMPLKNMMLTYKFNKLYYVWACVSLFSAVWVIFEQGIDITYFFTVTLEGNKGQWQKSNIVFIEYFSFMLPHISIISFFQIIFGRCKNRLEKHFNIFIIGASLYFTLFVMVSRGTAIIQLLGYLYIANRKKRLSFGRLGRVLVAIIFLFGAFSLLRWQDPTVGTIYSGRTDSLIFNSVYNYIVYCYQNLDTLIREGTPYTIYKYVFASISQALGLSSSSELRYISTGGFNAVPFIFGHYHDLGMIGVIIYPVIIVWMMSTLYNMSNRNEAYSIVLAMFQKGVFSVFFGDYILLFNAQNLAMVIAFLIIRSSLRDKREQIHRDGALIIQ